MNDALDSVAFPYKRRLPPPLGSGRTRCSVRPPAMGSQSLPKAYKSLHPVAKHSSIEYSRAEPPGVMLFGVSLALTIEQPRSPAAILPRNRRLRTARLQVDARLCMSRPVWRACKGFQLFLSMTREVTACSGSVLGHIAFRSEGAESDRATLATSAKRPRYLHHPRLLAKDLHTQCNSKAKKSHYRRKPATP